MHPVAQLRRDGLAAQARDGLQDQFLGDGAAGRFAPQRTHHVVQRGLAAGAQRQVQAQRHQRALGVVADRGIGRVLVAAVVLDPGVEAGLGHALHVLARRLAHAVHRAADQLDVARRVDEAAAQQEQVVVVGREALEEPQQLGVVLLRVVVGQELGRLQALHVPRMEVFVADQPQQRDIAVAGARHAQARQVLARGDQGGAGAVLEAAVAVFRRVEHEHVARERRLAAAVPEADLLVADALGVGQQARAVELRPRAADDELVHDTARRELAAPERAQLERVVGELVVVGRLEDLRARRLRAPGRLRARVDPRHPGGDVPTRRQLVQLDAMRLGGAAVDRQAQAGAVEEAAVVAEPGGAHRRVERVGVVRDDQRGAARSRDAPAILGQLHQRSFLRALARLEAAEMARELAHHVAARDPRGQAQGLLGRRIGDGQRDLELVGRRVGDLDSIVNHSARAARAARGRQSEFMGLL